MSKNCSYCLEKEKNSWCSIGSGKKIKATLEILLGEQWWQKI